MRATRLSRGAKGPGEGVSAEQRFVEQPTVCAAEVRPHRECAADEYGPLDYSFRGNIAETHDACVKRAPFGAYEAAPIFQQPWQSLADAHLGIAAALRG